MECFDCVVVGAGLYGLTAARQFHYTQPSQSLLILDSQSSLGGTWAQERLYPGLKTNNILGGYEIPGFPLDPTRFGIKKGEHIKGVIVHAYLAAYARDNGIAECIRLNQDVLSAEHQDGGGWILTIEGDKPKVFARRLIVSTGQVSIPYMPTFKGQENFGGRIFHAKHFSENSDTIKTAKSVTVFGATKFAWDAVYAYASAGVKVNWIIRASGHGPCWMASIYATPFKIWREPLANTRLLTFFSPCIWGDSDGYGLIRRLIHGTRLGRWIADKIFKLMADDTWKQNNYDVHPNTAKLKPWTEFMFTATSISALNYDRDIYSLIKSDLVHVHIGELDHLGPGMVHLEDGTSFQSDVLLASTGWKHGPGIKFLPGGIASELGIPHESSDSAPRYDLANQHTEVEAADQYILEQFPRLKRQSVWNPNYKPQSDMASGKNGREATPYMLYRFLVPSSPRFLRTRDIAFAGAMSNFSNAITAHMCGLWISAFFAGKRDLGLSPYRKGSWWGELVRPYGPGDYKGVEDEWLRVQGDEAGKN
ncbi:hypothetical protein B0I35DRAFT_398083 [Stachybotrys elegans]|uniref:FAD/NAD(P)-binding domain-containing protein n=1 Tax=Stachybotrys elegans TaxID=80388 RepID=A0A8K0WNX4_9HYPO|nr:hypothetical protein B0I35DRAFT_398083 [Stachybotrys elegans]